MKNDRKILKKQHLKIEQQTGIINNTALKSDYKLRGEEITSISERIIGLEEYHSRLTRIIERANQVQMAKMTHTN